jgi:hypothetical protein
VTAGQPVKFELSDQQWHAIIRCLMLPDSARADIELAIHAYRGRRSMWERPISTVEKRLKQVSAAAVKLARLLKGLDQRERIELVENWVHGQTNADRGNIEATISRIELLAAISSNASAQVSVVRPTYWHDWLIERLDHILQEFAGKRVSRAKAVLPFITQVCGTADKKFGPGAVVAAVQRFRSRVDFQEKNIAKHDAKMTLRKRSA